MHWLSDDWELKDLGLALVPLEGPHSGENMSEVFLQVIDTEFEVLEKVRGPKICLFDRNLFLFESSGYGYYYGLSG